MLVTIITKDNYIYDGVMVEGWQSYQEALNDECEARNVKTKEVDEVYACGKLVYKSK